MDCDLLRRIAEALERISPPALPSANLDQADAFVWRADESRLVAVDRVARVELDLLQGVERQKAVLLANTRAFAAGRPANNALLWGARGTGKSSLVKAVHAETPGLALVEVHRDDLASLSRLLDRLRASGRRFLLFCDDLSFDAGEGTYKALKVLLDGGIEGRPDNVLVYATSNRRHLISRDMAENEQGVAIHAKEVIDEKVSLSDRFGLWLGFHPIDQATYLAMIGAYAEAYGIEGDLAPEALQWSVIRGSRSGRVAWQFIQQKLGQG